MPVKHLTATYTILDHAEKTSNVSFNLQYPEPDTSIETLEKKVYALKAAIEPLIVGTIQKYQLSISVINELVMPSSSATRTSKWLVTYRDTTMFLLTDPLVHNPGHNKIFSFEIPCAKRDLLTSKGRLLDISDATVATSVSIFESIIRSPHNRGAAGLTPTNEIISIRFVGRNL